MLLVCSNKDDNSATIVKVATKSEVTKRVVLNNHNSVEVPELVKSEVGDRVHPSKNSRAIVDESWWQSSSFQETPVLFVRKVGDRVHPSSPLNDHQSDKTICDKIRR